MAPRHLLNLPLINTRLVPINGCVFCDVTTLDTPPETSIAHLPAPRKVGEIVPKMVFVKSFGNPDIYSPKHGANEAVFVVRV